MDKSQHSASFRHLTSFCQSEKRRSKTTSRRNERTQYVGGALDSKELDWTLVTRKKFQQKTTNKEKKDASSTNGCSRHQFKGRNIESVKGERVKQDHKKLQSIGIPRRGINQGKSTACIVETTKVERKQTEPGEKSKQAHGDRGQQDCTGECLGWKQVRTEQSGKQCGGF